jgi:hypothetical protein
MHDRKWLLGHGNAVSLHSGPFIKTKSRALVCDTSTLKCTACLCAIASCQSPSNQDPRPLQKNQLLKQGHLRPGDCVSADCYFSPVQGCLLHTFAREKHGYTCGSLYVDHASRKIFNCPQFSTNTLETINSALRLESMVQNDGFKIKGYHSDNGIFDTKDFREYCNQQQQHYSFSGVGAKHQHGVAERNIKTIAQWARANMLHLATHWPQYASLSFWPQAIDYLVWVFNKMTNMENGLSPNEI